MEQIFAPWRMEFIEKHSQEKTLKCILCELSKGSPSVENLVLSEGKFSYLCMNKYPYTHAHLMVVPKRHIPKWESLNLEEVTELGLTTQRALKVLDRVFHPDGFNLGVNLGHAAGAGIREHVHQHIVPRWIGDINFMPLLGETKVISEHLESSYRKIKEIWEEMK